MQKMFKSPLIIVVVVLFFLKQITQSLIIAEIWHIEILGHSNETHIHSNKIIPSIWVDPLEKQLYYAIEDVFHIILPTWGNMLKNQHFVSCNGIRNIVQISEIRLYYMYSAHEDRHK